MSSAIVPLSIMLIFFLIIGTPVAFSLIVTGLVGLAFLVNPSQIVMAGDLLWGSLYSYSLTSVPLFIFMAEILMQGGVAHRVYQAAIRWLGGIPGGAAYTNIAVCTVFAAMSGSSVANAAAVGTVAGPAMVEAGYSKRLAFGSIAAGGTLGILIPPSTALIIYGSMTGESIGKLFVAGIIPGVIMSLLFILTIFAWGLLRPQDSPPYKVASWKERLQSLVDLLPPLLIIVVVLGGIYKGIVSPTESAAIGVVCSLLIVLLRRQFGWKQFVAAVDGTLRVTSMILLIVGAASLMTFVVGYLRIPTLLAEAIITLDVPLWGTLSLIALLYILLGCFIESTSLIVLTVPVLFPLMVLLGVNTVWFGIYLVVLVEIGLLTPPVGLNLYVLQGIKAGQTFEDIAFGAAPFVLVQTAVLILIMAFPIVVTWLPQTMAR